MTAKTIWRATGIDTSFQLIAVHIIIPVLPKRNGRQTRRSANKRVLIQHFMERWHVLCPATFHID